jgi:nucleotide-binding universal stress UspA family protein
MHGQLLYSIRKFVKDQRELIARHLDAQTQKSLRNEIDRIASELEDKIQAFEQERERGGPFRTIVVAVDESEPSEFAVRMGVKIGGEYDATLLLVHVVDTASGLGPEFGVDQSFIRTKQLDYGHAILQAAQSHVPHEFNAQVVLREGNPAEQIVQVAKDQSADLIIIGTRARGRVARLFLGSTAEAVLRSAPCPVLSIGREVQDVTLALHEAAGARP